MFILILLFFGLDVKAQLIEPQKSAFQYEVVEFRPEKDHHFELEAEQSCSQGQVVDKKKELIRCQMLKEGVSKVTLNVCDDKKTFCKPYDVEVQVRQAPQGASKEVLSPNLLEMKEVIHEELLPGFQTVSLTDARQMAKKHDGPVLVMISTDWCPPCNQSKEYVLSTPEFRELSKNWLKLYVDGDSKDSVEYDEALSFSFYPTFILLNSQMEEVSRFYQEFSLKNFKEWADRSLRYSSSNYESVREKVLARKSGNWWQRILDFILFRSNEDLKRDLEFVVEVAIAKSDVEFIQMTTLDETPEFLKSGWLKASKDSLVPSQMSKEEYALKLLEYSRPGTLFAYELIEVCDLKLSQCQEEEKNLEDRLKWFEERKEYTEVENLMSIADEYHAQMIFYSQQKNKKERIESAKGCVNSFEELIPHSRLKVPRYAMQGILACAKEYDLSRAKKVYMDLIEKYPEDPTFILRYAKFFKNELKDLKQAKVWAIKALKTSYDFNWYYAASLKIQIDQELKDISAARETLSEAFSRLQLSEDRDSRYQKVLTRLRQIEDSLTSI